MSTLYQWFLRPDTFPVLRWPEPVLSTPGIQDWDNRNDSNWGAGAAVLSNGTDFDPTEARLSTVDTLYYQRDTYARWTFFRELFGNWKISLAQGGSLGDRHFTAGWADAATVDFTAPHNNYGGAGDALFFEINTGIGQTNWHAVALRAGVITRVDSSVAPKTDGTGDELRIVWDGINATFYIDGVQVAQIAAANGPTLTVPMHAGMRGYSGDPGATGGTFNNWDLLIFDICYGGSP
jgi:hypothetical protein